MATRSFATVRKCLPQMQVISDIMRPMTGNLSQAIAIRPAYSRATCSMLVANESNG